jgi:hypothetical protein
LRERKKTALRERKETALRERKETALRERKETALRERKETALRESKETALIESKETALRERKETALRESKETRPDGRTSLFKYYTKSMDVFLEKLEFSRQREEVCKTDNLDTSHFKRLVKGWLVYVQYTYYLTEGYTRKLAPLSHINTNSPTFPALQLASADTQILPDGLIILSS